MNIKLPYLNLGCGNNFHASWTNVDFLSCSSDVIPHNLLHGIPFENESFEVVYHSHVLEHFAKEDAQKFIKECYRVLKPNGIIRIAIPDLEQIVINYIKVLKEVIENSASKEAQNKYDWILFEMYDQTVRNKTGGEMLKYLATETDLDFVINRCGGEIKNIIDQLKFNPSIFQNNQELNSKKINYFKEFYRLLRYANKKERLLKLLLKDEYKALQIGRFRLGGEIHQWMYDRHSLNKILSDNGFGIAKQKTAYESTIENWTSFKLELTDENLVRKPDSLFMEAIKVS